MLLAAKLALGPVLLPQAVWVRRTAPRLPEAPGPREGLAGDGPRQLNLLVVGDSSAAGVGLEHQSRALALPLAAALARRLGGEVAWRLIARSGVNTGEARALLALSPLPAADVVVTALGVNDVSSQVPRDRFLAQTAGLWADLRQRSGARWAALSGLPPMQRLTAVPQPLRWYLGRYAAVLDSALRDWTAREQLGYCALHWATDAELLAPDGFHPGAALYPQWVQRLADLIESQQKRWLPSVRPEPVQGPEPASSVRPEPVSSLRPEPVSSLRREPVSSVRPEPVEGQRVPQGGLAGWHDRAES